MRDSDSDSFLPGYFFQDVYSLSECMKCWSLLVKWDSIALLGESTSPLGRTSGAKQALAARHKRLRHAFQASTSSLS